MVNGGDQSGGMDRRGRSGMTGLRNIVVVVIVIVVVIVVGSYWSGGVLRLG